VRCEFLCACMNINSRQKPEANLMKQILNLYFDKPFLFETVYLDHKKMIDKNKTVQYEVLSLLFQNARSHLRSTHIKCSTEQVRRNVFSNSVYEIL
jgi:hypothetical protein